MKKKVLLLAVSCKHGGLCPGGVDLDNPAQWIRIVADDGNSGSVQGRDIAYAQPLDVIEFDGRPAPQGKQIENWVIDNNSCKKIDSFGEIENDSVRLKDFLEEVYNQYSYHGFWNNDRDYLNEQEFNAVKCPTESIIKVSDIHVYKNDYNKSKISFTWNDGTVTKRIRNISMTDQEYYGTGNFTADNAYRVIA